jgi:hypothetical protein
MELGSTFEVIEVVLLCDEYGSWSPDVPKLGSGEVFVGSPSAGGIPSLEEATGAQLVIVLGPLVSAPHADQLAGVLRIAVRDHGTVVVLAYPGDLTSGADALLIDALTGVGIQAQRPVRERISPSAPAFARYFELYGRTHVQFNRPDHALTLGELDGEQCAFALAAGAGAIYVLPYTVANLEASHARLVQDLVEAVRAHRGGADEPLPDFLADLRLPGENVVLEEIEQLSSRLKELRTQAGRLERYRHLIGRLSGDPFEKLVIDSLNVVLDATDHHAEDREDVGAEDFWIVAPGGDHALAEAKGIGSHVRRRDVSQVEMHRAQIQGEEDDELPGLLVVNIFRSTGELKRRQLPVSDDIARHAARLNVLILRGWDLYQLVARALTDPETGRQFLAQLSAGGGWLEVTAEALSLHTGNDG